MAEQRIRNCSGGRQYNNEEIDGSSTGPDSRESDDGSGAYEKSISDRPAKQHKHVQ